jgi:hypothetical protein
MTIPTVNIPFVNRVLRLVAAWAAVLYPVISAVQGTTWGAKDSVLTTAGAVLLWIEHYNATPNVTATVPAPVQPTKTPPVA